MIEINLLPERERKVEATPIARQITNYVGVLAVVGLLAVNAVLQFNTLRNYEKKLEILNQSIADLTVQVQQVRDDEAKIAEIKNHVNTVTELYKNRVVWAKLLQDVKTSVNSFYPGVNINRRNKDGVYFWLSRISLLKARGVSRSRRRVKGAPVEPKQMLELVGYASTNEGSGGKRATRASNIVQQFVKFIVDYVPTVEGSEEKRRELAAAAAAAGESDPNELIARTESPEEGIAYEPFYSYFMRHAIQQMQWEEFSGKKDMPEMPLGAVKFTVDFFFTPPVETAKKK